jgi:hypothetical protein
VADESTVEGDQEVPEMIIQPGEGRMLPGPEIVTLKLTAAQTNGSIGVLEHMMQNQREAGHG